MQALDFGGGGIDAAAAQGGDELAGGIALGSPVVGVDPRLSLWQPLRIDGPDAGPRLDVRADADPPGLGADAGPKAPLPLAHPDVDRVGCQSPKTLGDTRIGRIEGLMQRHDAQTRGRAVQPHIPIRMVAEKCLHVRASQGFRSAGHVHPQARDPRRQKIGQPQSKRHGCNSE